ncbi:MAG: ABC transporter permease [Paludibacteraceae bacterium]|nr:ABC transporter permease [Paludibacteraceae bacterium]
MNAFISFVKKECIHILRDVRTMMIVLLIPVILTLLFGFAISTEINDISVAVVVNKYTPDVRRDISALEQNPYISYSGIIEEHDIDAVLRSGKCAAVVMFGRDGKRNVVLDASNSSLSASAGSYITAILNNDKPMPLPIATYMRHNPQLKSAYNFVPGIIGLIFILICALMTCVSVVREKEMGTMETLLVSPIRPVLVVLAKMVPYLCISLVNLATILLLSHYVLEMPIHGNLPTLLGLCVLYILLSLTLGLLVSTLAQTQMVALLICAMVMMMPMMMLSGMLFPLENLPPVLKQITYVIPARWFNEAIRKVMVEGMGITGIWKEFSILLAMTIALFAASIKKFNDRLE